MKEQELFDGLRQLTRGTFPKQCSGCSKIYYTLEQFLDETQRVRNSSGLISSIDEEDNTVVEVYRNCSCGSTLMDLCHDRRDSTEAGLKRRVLFETMQKKLIKAGISQKDAREELLNLLHGKPCPLLTKLGFRTVNK